MLTFETVIQTTIRQIDEAGNIVGKDFPTKPFRVSLTAKSIQDYINSVKQEAAQIEAQLAKDATKPE